MHTVVLQKRLGNQLHQVAFGMWLTAHSGIGVLYDPRDDITTLRQLLPELEIGKAPAHNLVTDDRAVGPDHPMATHPARWAGFWQRRCYAEHLLPILRERLSAAPVRDVVHVRGEDILGTPTACSPAYYAQAVAGLLRPVTAVSDAPGLCQEMGFAYRAGHELDDLALMANASHLVLSRSSFSWWGAMLNTTGVVTAPRPWFAERTGSAGRDSLLLDPRWRSLPG